MRPSLFSLPGAYNDRGIVTTQIVLDSSRKAQGFGEV
jgi:hypothetical protein